MKVLPKPLSIISPQSWLTREVLIDWKLSDVMPMYKKGQEDNLGNCRTVSIPSEPRKAMEQITLCVSTQNMQDNRGSGPASMGLCKAGPAWCMLFPFLTK